MTEAEKTYDKPVNAAILAIMGEIGTVGKGGENKYQNYKYVKASDIDAKLQPLMARHGVLVIQTEVDHKFIDNGDAVEFTYNFHVMHTSGDVLMTVDHEGREIPLVGRRTGMSCARNSKGGFDDKCGNKCGTAASKYFLRDLFRIPTLDIDDADAEPDRPATMGGGMGAPAGRHSPAERPQPEAPVNPETGEVSPHHIARSDGVTPSEWGQVFFAAIKSAKTLKELAEWSFHNEEELARIRAEAPLVIDRIELRQAERQHDLSEAADPIAPILEELKMCRTKRALEQVWRGYASKIDALPDGARSAFAVAFQAHEKRVAALN